MPAEARATEAGRALVEDAARRVRRIDVAEKFAVTPSRRLLLPVLPAVAALMVALWSARPWCPSRRRQCAHGGPAAGPGEESGRSAPQNLEERKQQAEKEGLKDATAILKKLEEGTKELSLQPDRGKAMAKINELTAADCRAAAAIGRGGKDQAAARTTEEDRSGAGRQAGPGPAARRFQKAADRVEEAPGASSTTRGSTMRPSRVGQVNCSRWRRSSTRWPTPPRPAQANVQQQTRQLRRKTVRMVRPTSWPSNSTSWQQQAPQMQQMQQLAKQLGKCAQCLGKGARPARPPRRCSNSRPSSTTSSSNWTSCEALDGAMEQMAQCRQAMNCPHCGGAGCEQCQGEGFCQGQGKGQGGPGPEARLGPGRRRPGKGHAPRPRTRRSCTTRGSGRKWGQGRHRHRRGPGAQYSRQKWRRDSSSSSTRPAAATPIRSAAAISPQTQRAGAGVFRPLSRREVVGRGLRTWVLGFRETGNYPPV